MFSKFSLLNFVDYKFLQSVSGISQKTCNEDVKSIYKLHWTIRRILVGLVCLQYSQKELFTNNFDKKMYVN